jgi:DnaJ like chaperone protein
MVFGKIILTFIGLKLSSWLGFSPLAGCVGGFFIGHIVDLGIARKIANYQAKKYWANVKKAEANRNFVESMFVILGRLAAADGPINKVEEDKFLEIIKKYLKLDRKQLKKLKPLFTNGPIIEGSIQYHTARLFEATNSDQNMLIGFHQLMIDFADADGKVTPAETEILATVGQIIGVPYGRSYAQGNSGNFSSANSNAGRENQQRASAEPPPQQSTKSADPYTVLGCAPSDSTDKIRSQYRKLAGEFHPDRIMGKDLSKEFIDFATERFKAVGAAYERIKQERGF